MANDKRFSFKEADLGIKLRFVVWVAIVLVGTLSLVSVLLISNQSQVIKNQIASQGKILGQFIATTVEPSILYGDNAELERIVNEFIKDHKDSIDYLVISDYKDRPLTFSSKRPDKIDAKKTLVIFTPVLDDLGKVEIGFSLASVNRQIMGMVVNIAALIVLAILFSGLGIILISRRLIIQPAFQVEQTNKQLKDLTQELDKKVQERTVQLQVMKELAEKERDKTLTIIRNFSDGLMILDPYGTIAMVNSEAEKIIGAAKDKIERKKPKDLAGDNEFFKKFVDIVFSGNSIKEVSRNELGLGKNKTIEITIIPLSREESELGFLAVLHDISREKIVEKLKTEFVSLAAHQLRTPLSEIKWALRMILDKDFGRISKEQKTFIEKTYNANEKVVALINDLLDVTKIEEGRYIFNLKKENIGKIVKAVVDSLEKEIKEKNLQIEFKKQKGGVPDTIIDSEKIEVAVRNLIENAVRYTKPNGKITISLESNAKEIEFSIRDSGVGIPEEEKGRIFNKFFRAANVVKMETEGTGLGLFIMKNIIEAHRGSVWFESEEDKGSSFYFTLPIVNALEENVKLDSA